MILLISLFLNAKTISKLIIQHNIKFEIKILKNCRGGHGLKTAQNLQYLVISRCCFVEDDKEMYQELYRACKAVILLISPLV